MKGLPSDHASKPRCSLGLSLGFRLLGRLGLYGEGIQQAKEGLEICRQTGDAKGQSHCLYTLELLGYYPHVVVASGVSRERGNPGAGGGCS